MAILIPLLAQQKDCSSMPHHLYNRNHVKNHEFMALVGFSLSKKKIQCFYLVINVLTELLCQDVDNIFLFFISSVIFFNLAP